MSQPSKMKPESLRTTWKCRRPASIARSILNSGPLTTGSAGKPLATAEQKYYYLVWASSESFLSQFFSFLFFLFFFFLHLSALGPVGPIWYYSIYGSRPERSTGLNLTTRRKIKKINKLEEIVNGLDKEVSMGRSTLNLHLIV